MTITEDELEQIRQIVRQELAYATAFERKKPKDRRGITRNELVKYHWQEFVRLAVLPKELQKMIDSDRRYTGLVVRRQHKRRPVQLEDNREEVVDGDLNVEAPIVVVPEAEAPVAEVIH